MMLSYTLQNHFIADKILFAMKFKMLDGFRAEIGRHNVGYRLPRNRENFKKSKKKPTTDNNSKAKVDLSHLKPHEMPKPCSVKLTRCDARFYDSDDSAELSDHFDSYFDDHNDDDEDENFSNVNITALESKASTENVASETLFLTETVLIKEEPTDFPREEVPANFMVRLPSATKDKEGNSVEDSGEISSANDEMPNIAESRVQDQQIDEASNFSEPYSLPDNLPPSPAWNDDDDDSMIGQPKTDSNQQDYDAVTFDDLNTSIADGEVEPDAEVPIEEKIEKIEKFKELISKRKIEHFFCDACGMTFKQGNIFKLHMQDHDRGINPTCDFCNQKFVTSFAKMRHMVKKHNVTPEETEFVDKETYDCNDCSKKFKYEDQIIQHNMKHHRERCSEEIIKSFTCPFCFLVCIRRNQLKFHIKDVHMDKRFQCKACFQEFSREKALRYHMDSVHGKLPVELRFEVCETCKAPFASKLLLKTHVQEQHTVRLAENVMIGNEQIVQMNAEAAIKQKARQLQKKKEKTFPCIYCGEVLQSNWKRKAHYAHIHDEGKEPKRSCKSCQIEFRCFNTFKAHIDTHQDPFLCQICGSKANSNDELDKHMKTHKQIHKERKYICDCCGGGYLSKSHLALHMPKHLNLRNFMCSTCGAGFNYKAVLQSHQLSCSGESVTRPKPYVCETCGKKFIKKVFLVEHQRVHTNERPFSCTICQYSFMTKNSMRQHYATHAETRKKLKCEICNKLFNFPTVKRKHDLKFHPEKFPFRCQFDGVVFLTEGGLRAHMTAKHSDIKNIS